MGKILFLGRNRLSIQQSPPPSNDGDDFFFLLYYRALLDTHKNLPRTDWVLKGSVVVAGCLFFIFFFMPYGIRIQLANLQIVWTLVLGIPTCFLRYRQKYEPAIYPLIGIFAIFLPAGYTIYQTSFGTAPVGVVGTPSVFGIVIDSLMLSFALSSRYKVLRAEKEKAQQEKLALQETLVSELKRTDQLKKMIF